MSETLAVGGGVRREPPAGLPRLLAGSRAPSHADHEAYWGALPRTSYDELLRLLRGARLAGRGGAGFPTWRKLTAAMESRRPPVVIANATESEPLSAKDRLLLSRSPHLVLDGLAVVARTVGATRVVVCMKPDATAWQAVTAALQERRGRVDPVTIELVAAPPRYLAGQESSIVALLAGGDAIPLWSTDRLSVRGPGGRPTLVHNVETLANIAMLVRYGDGWFGSVGTDEEPGSLLASVHAAHARPRVAEIAAGAPLRELLPATDAAGPVLVGGFHGAWLRADQVDSAAVSNAGLALFGTGVGSGVVLELPADVCPVSETARIVGWLAMESAGQCGPCLSGLPRIAAAMSRIAERRATPADLAALHRWAGLVTGRGACHHPDGSIRMLRSALTAFAAEVDAHLAGHCTATRHEPVLTLPPGPRRPEDWR